MPEEAIQGKPSAARRHRFRCLPASEPCYPSLSPHCFVVCSSFEPPIGSTVVRLYAGLWPGTTPCLHARAFEREVGATRWPGCRVHAPMPMPRRAHIAWLPRVVCAAPASLGCHLLSASRRRGRGHRHAVPRRAALRRSAVTCHGATT